MKKLVMLSAGLLVSLLANTGNKRQDIDWADYDGPGAIHYSPLDQINEKTVSKLGLAWYFDIDVGGSSLTAPVAVGGTLYFAAGGNVIHALDVRTGKMLWQYDTGARQAAGEKLRSVWGSRGIAYANGRIFTGTIDGRLIALDAKTGQPLWSMATVGKDDGRYISGAPWVYKDKVVIGHGGADFAAVRGYVTAFDQSTGKQAWRFYTAPGQPGVDKDWTTRFAAKSWTGEWWKFGGGATVWNAMAYDPKYNRIYLGTGNGAPWNQKIRSPGGGDNLFVCSIIALDADTGEYIWHYQTNPGETWDFNSNMDIELASLKIDGKDRDVIMHAPKNGFFYVIDRSTGKLISAKPIVPMNWASGIDMKTGRPVENPDARFPDGKAAIVYPSPTGAHNIEAMSFNPKSGLVYIPVMDQGYVYVDPPKPLEKWKFLDGQRISNGIGIPSPDIKPRKPAAALLAWNPVTQKEIWRKTVHAPRGGGATVATGGNLVIQGQGTGEFVIMASDTGKELWSFNAQTAVVAQPITYSVGGKQYITVIAGSRYPPAQGIAREWNYGVEGWRVLTFAIDGKAKLPPPDTTPLPNPAVDPDFVLDNVKARRGQISFSQRCAGCHGANALSGGAAPDLLRSSVASDKSAFDTILKDGVLVERGMPRFADLTEPELDELRHYIQLRARDLQAGNVAIERKGDVRATEQ